MRKTAVLMVALLLTVLASAAMAAQGCLGPGREMLDTKAGKLFLFQKCYDEENGGCPASEEGPWPILLTGRWGQMKYNLLGERFRFSFEGKKLVPNTEYTLIYYPDPWPGENLICLGDRKSNRAGNLQINGSMEIATGLPTPDDANYLPQGPAGSGAVGAKIWLVRSADVDCVGTPATETQKAVPPQMIGWTPEDYLFEANLIVYQYQSPDQDAK